MIELKVEEHCHRCCQFEPEMKKESLFGDGMFVYDCQTTITCKHAEVCANSRQYILNMMEKGSNNDRT